MPLRLLLMTRAMSACDGGGRLAIGVAMLRFLPSRKRRRARVGARPACLARPARYRRTAAKAGRRRSGRRATAHRRVTARPLGRLAASAGGGGRRGRGRRLWRRRGSGTFSAAFSTTAASGSVTVAFGAATGDTGLVFFMLSVTTTQTTAMIPSSAKMKRAFFVRAPCPDEAVQPTTSEPDIKRGAAGGAAGAAAPGMFSSRNTSELD